MADATAKLENLFCIGQWEAFQLFFQKDNLFYEEEINYVKFSGS